LFTFEPGVALWSIIAFCLALFIIQSKVYPPVRQMLDQRKAQIENNLADAEKKKTEALSLLAESDDKIRNIRLEEQRILSEAREKANDLYHSYEQKALTDARKLRQEKEHELKDMEQSFIVASEGKISSMISNVCDKVLAVELTPEQQETIIKARIDELAKLKEL
jgi:F-type H+-transporting ATPase subunit b